MAAVGPLAQLVVASNTLGEVIGLVEPDLAINENQAHVRFGHFAPGVAAVTVSVGGVAVASNLVFGSASSYVPVAAGTQTVSISGGVDVDVGLGFDEQKVYSIYAYLPAAG